MIQKGFRNSVLNAWNETAFVPREVYGTVFCILEMKQKASTILFPKNFSEKCSEGRVFGLGNNAPKIMITTYFIQSYQVVTKNSKEIY